MSETKDHTCPHPTGWRYKVLVNKHGTGDPLPGQISMLDIHRTAVWGNPGEWRYSDGPEKPNVDWMCEAEPLYTGCPAPTPEQIAALEHKAEMWHKFALKQADKHREAYLALERQRNYLAMTAQIPARITHCDYDPAGSTTEYEPDKEAVELFGEDALHFCVGCGPYSTHYKFITSLERRVKELEAGQNVR